VNLFKFSRLAAIAAVTLINSTAFAAQHVIFNEARHGDLPGPAYTPEDWTAVHMFDLVPGKNVIKGSIAIEYFGDEFGTINFDSDPFRLRIPPGFECKVVRLAYTMQSDANLEGFMLRMIAIDRKRSLEYQDDVVIHSTSEYLPAPTPSPTRLFRRPRNEGSIPPLDDFPATGLNMRSGIWDIDPQAALIQTIGNYAAGTYRYRLEFIVTPRIYNPQQTNR